MCEFGGVEMGCKDAFEIGAKKSAIYEIVGCDDEKYFEESGEHDAKFISVLIPKDQIVLDLGSGIGRVGVYLSKHCKIIFSMDFSKEMIKQGIKRLDKFNVNNIQFIMGDTIYR